MIKPKYNYKENMTLFEIRDHTEPNCILNLLIYVHLIGETSDHHVKNYIYIHNIVFLIKQGRVNKRYNQRTQ